jgi:hypothetical protein
MPGPTKIPPWWVYGFSKWLYPDANHGAGIFTYIKTPKMSQFCRYIFQHHGASGI